MQIFIHFLFRDIFFISFFISCNYKFFPNHLNINLNTAIENRLDLTAQSFAGDISYRFVLNSRKYEVQLIKLSNAESIDLGIPFNKFSNSYCGYHMESMLLNSSTLLSLFYCRKRLYKL